MSSAPQARLARNILVVEDDALLREQVCLALRARYDVAEAGSVEDALARLAAQPADVVLVDLQLRAQGTVEDGFSILREVRRMNTDSIVIVMTGDPHYETRLRAIEEGAFDCFTKPFDLRELDLVVRRSLERLDLERENRRLKAVALETYSFQNLIGSSPPMARVFDTIRRIASSPATVLLLGESGTGKELVARAIHFQSSRRDGPFIPVHCSALPESLLETELFGHEKGAFTGAVTSKPGRFEMAHGGTLFLDEVATLNLSVQTKLLRVLEEKQFERVGGRKSIQVDMRLIAAANEDLEQLVRDGRFREDLFFRINVLPLHLPPLRERREDLPLLVSHFLRVYCRQCGFPLKRMSREAMHLLNAYSWKGNVRELENVIQRAVLLAEGEEVLPEHLPAHISGQWSGAAGGPALPSGGLSLPQEVERYERALLLAALKQANGVKMGAARLLGITKEQMKYLVRKHHLDGKNSPQG